MKRRAFITATVMFLFVFFLGILIVLKVSNEQNCISDGKMVACICVSFIVWKLTYHSYLWMGRDSAIAFVMFLIVIFAPILVGWKTDFFQVDTENRTLAEKPVFKMNDGKDYFSDMDAYLADYVPFRKVWLRINGFVRYGIFHSSDKAISMPGKDGWIYYGSDGLGKGEDPIADYRQTNLFSEEQMADLCASLVGFKNYVNSQGKKFYVMINLNKSHIYPEYLPDNIRSGNGVSRAEQFIAYLKENTDIQIVYPKKALLDMKKDYLLYCPTDAHWNTVGGFIGFAELMKAIEPGFVTPSLAEILPEYERSNWGDVANIINASWFTNNQWSTTHYKPDIVLEWIDRSEKDSSLYIDNSNGNGKRLLVYHDSFMNQMMEYLAKEFTHCEFIEKQFQITEEDISSKNPDLVVFEILERMLNNYTGVLRYWQKYN